jgi:small subunit ribosomal protein S6
VAIAGTGAAPGPAGPQGDVMSQRKYELVYLFKPETPEQTMTDMHTQVETIVGRMGGTIEKTENWGKRKLAYEIGHHKEGIYVLEVIFGGGELMKELDRRLKVSEDLMRHLIVRVDEDETVVERSRSKRLEESRRRRIARGLPPDRQPGEGPAHEDRDDDRDELSLGTEI